MGEGKLRTIFAGLSPEALEALLSKFKPVDYPRRALLTEEGQTERYLYFVLEGVQRSYFFHGDKDITFQFTYAGDFSGIPESFLLQKPSRFYLECLSPSRLLRLAYPDLQELSGQYPELLDYRRRAVEYVLDRIILQQQNLMSMDAEERLRAFLERSGHLLQTIPQKYIASYLSMSEATFSKLLHNVRFNPKS